MIFVISSIFIHHAAVHTLTTQTALKRIKTAPTASRKA